MNLTIPSEKRRFFGRRRRGKRERDIIYLPTKQNHTSASVTAGLVCRAVLAAAYVSGLCLFVADAFCLVPDKAGPATIFMSAFFFAAAITLLFKGGIASAVGAVALAGGIFARLAIVSVDFADLVVKSVAAVHNTVIETTVDAGLTTVHNWYIILPTDADGAIYNEADLYKIGLMLLTLILSLYLVPVIVRRCHPLPIVIVTAAFIVPASIYNIIRSNWGFSILVAAIAGVFVLWTHDKKYTKYSNKKRFVTDDEPVPLFEDAVGSDGRKEKAGRKKGAAKKSAKAGVSAGAEEDGDLFILESSADRRRRRKAERAEDKRLRLEKKRVERMKKKDARRSEKLDGKTVSENLSLGGITGLAAAAMAFLIIVLPARFVTESDPGIPFIKDVVDDVRKYMNAIFWSEEVDLNKVPSPNGTAGSNAGPRPTETIYPEYNDVIIATVEVPYNAPVYLRTWIGTRYSDDRWYSASYDDIDNYKALFGEDFTPEKITESYYDAMYPLYSEYADSSAYSDNTTIGFIYERVSITNKSDTAPLICLPSVAMPSKGILSYNSKLPSPLPYSYYFDGIWTSNFFLENTSFSTESIVTTMRYPEIGSVYARGINEYLSTLELLSSGEPDMLIGTDEETALRYAEMYAEKFGAESAEDSLLYRYLTEMTDEQRASLRQNGEIERAYASYVRDTYLQTDENDTNIIGAKATEALWKAGKTSRFSPSDPPPVSDYHDIVMTMIDFLSENYEYSIEPPEKETETVPETDVEEEETEEGVTEETKEIEDAPWKTALVKFLTETKTGYCVQFASSLVMMLRSVGIPARYCEGYIASDFSSGLYTDRETSLYYAADILDSNAHAWVEVYYDGIGWVQYEATPTYHDAIYGSGLEMPEVQTPGQPNEPEPPKKPEPPKENEDPLPQPGETPVEDKTDPTVPIWIAAVVIAVIWIAAVVLIVVMKIKSRSGRALRARAKLIERCTDMKKEMSEEELRDCAHRLDLGIFDVYGALGLAPETGELSGEYAERLDKSIGEASDTGIPTVLELIGREEFGHSLTREGLCRLAEYYEDLTSNVYEGLSFKNRFMLRTVKHIL